MARSFLLTGALAAALAVILGAFGAHALESRTSVELVAVWRTAVGYHFNHALALLFVGILLQRDPSSTGTRWSGVLFIAGIVLFSGSLYLLVLTGLRWLGAVTPVGGIALVAGWLLLAWGVWRRPGHCPERPR